MNEGRGFVGQKEDETTFGFSKEPVNPLFSLSFSVVRGMGALTVYAGFRHIALLGNAPRFHRKLGTL